MKVVILCGGKGTRLREETEFRPKPMVPIGPRPVLWHIMKYYASFGHKEFILCLGYKGDMIKDYFRNYLWQTCDISLSLGRKSKVKFHDRHNEEDWTVTLADTARILTLPGILGDWRPATALNLDGGSSSGLWAATSPAPVSLPEFGHVRNYIGIAPR